MPNVYGRKQFVCCVDKSRIFLGVTCLISSGAQRLVAVLALSLVLQNLGQRLSRMRIAPYF